MLFLFFMEIRVGNRIAEVELVSRDGERIRLTIDGVLHEVDVALLRPGRCSVLFEGQSYQAEFVRRSKSGHYDVFIDQDSFQIQIQDVRTKYLHGLNNRIELPEDHIVAPMPGKVVRVLVKEGSQLYAGDIAVVLEAMKMQSNYKVSADCRVKKVLVQEGDLVQAGQVLVLLDREK